MLVCPAKAGVFSGKQLCSQNSTTRRIRGLEKAMQQCYINVVIVRSSFCGGQVRFLFGMGEAGAFPIATRSLSRWMLPAERGFAQGITHAGSRLGAAFTPALVAFIIAGYGWRAPFVCFGVLGLLWASVWFWYYRDSPAEYNRMNAAERELIQSALESAAVVRRAVPWRRILSSPQMWMICAMYCRHVRAPERGMFQGS